jgi:hypothetical protein
MPFSESELHFSKATFAVVMLALAACILVAADLLHERDDIGFVAYPALCAACVIRVRQFFCRWQRHLDRAITRLEDNLLSSFEMGRAVGREEAAGAVLRRLPMPDRD